MEQFARLRLAYTAIVLPVAGTLWRGRDERMRDAAGTLRPIVYRRTPDIDHAEFHAIWVLLLGRRRAALRMHPALLVLLVLIFLGMLRATVDLWRVQQFSLLSAWLLILPVLAAWSTWYFDARLIPHRFPPENVSDAWLSRNRRPACTYPLYAAGPGEARRRCAECGAIWHSPPVPTPSPPPPPPAPCTSSAPTPGPHRRCSPASPAMPARRRTPPPGWPAPRA